MDQVIQNLHMNGGTGETSYAFNSSVQKKAFYKTKPLIEEAALDIFSKFYACSSATMTGKSMPIGIADLGCSSGPNTLLLFSYLLNTIYDKCREFDSVSPEIKQRSFGPCFAARIPGTFYDRLVPRDTLHFVHCSYSLHWLSQVPPEIENNNQGNIYISNLVHLVYQILFNPLKLKSWLRHCCPPSMIDAHLKQFTSDFTGFLKCRSGELVMGGRMVLTFLGRASVDPTSDEGCSFWGILALGLKDMVLEGMIEEQKLISFNIPHYMTSTEEVSMVIQCEGSFKIDQIEVFKVNWDSSEDENSEVDSYKAANCIRAVSESLLMSRFGIGEEIINKLFHRYMEIVDNVPKEKAKYTNIVISLTKV
ncbi:hypothetical protein MKW98_004955 [Papaver atlanticum]|uniref:Uncharacterized protein n=1 Tax=Papaver atlanticum TaxID=357466 RepID=A0AAD4TFI6_9MAGN|nr:hypothetical protein MKW98_004955 [Papaver atlanticum]